MTRYFEAKTNTGILQIADDIQCLRLQDVLTLGDYFVESEATKYRVRGGSYQSYTAHCYALPLYNNRIAYISNPSTSPAHVFTRGAVYVYKYIDHSPSEIGLHKVVAVSNVSKAIADAMKVYVFSESVVPAISAGMECYNESGERVFSSDSKLLKLLNIVNFKHCANTKYDTIYHSNGFEYINNTHTYNNKTIAMWSDLAANAEIQDSLGSGWFTLPILTKNSLQVTMADTDSAYNSSLYTIHGYFRAAAWPVRYNCSMYSIADVTNY